MLRYFTVVIISLFINCGVAIAEDWHWIGGAEGGLGLITINSSSPNILYARIGSAIFKSNDRANNWQRMQNLTGAIQTIIVDSTVSSTIYAGTLQGLFRSTNAGENWVNLMPSYPVTSLVVNPKTPSILYAGTTSPTVGILKSTDGGASWISANNGLPGIGPTLNLAIDPITPDTLYVALLNYGVYKSIDGGANWTRILDNTSYNNIVLDPTDSNTIYAHGTYTDISKSTDGGSTWDKITHEIFAWIAIDPVIPTTIYATYSNGIYKSIDGGRNWGVLSAINGSAGTLRIDPGNTQILYVATSHGLLKSTDSGKSWVVANKGSSVPAFKVVLNPGSTYSVYTQSDYVWKGKDNNGTWEWTEVVGPFSTSSLPDQVVQPGRHPILFEGDQHISLDGGDSWRTIADNGPLYAGVEAIAAAPSNPNILYASLENGSVVKSVDNGNRWSKIPNVTLSSNLSGWIVVNPIDSDVVYAGNYKSADGGNTWEPFQVDTGSEKLQIYKLVLNPVTPTTFYACVYSRGIYKTMDAGKTWTNVYAKNVRCDDLGIDKISPDTLYQSSPLEKSVDTGVNWNPITASPPELAQPQVWSFAVDPFTAGKLYIATTAGIFVTESNSSVGESVDLNGTVKTQDGQDICAMVLASGKFMFSCNPIGMLSLTGLPSEPDGTVKRQIYADGFFPKIDILPGSTDEAVVMTRSGRCPSYNIRYDPAVVSRSAGKRIDITGKVLAQNSQTPICAMVLANGQHMFSCDGTGSYALNIPLDNNGQFKLQVYADGFAPTIQIFDEFKVANDVRMARATECQ